ncbi:PEP-CTERM sorting domain-containing protein [Nostoc flagelliforme]|uniref:PEP-CTERM sorting domain-containing protein n=1 Tax=Nostoc flagelliforme TaxID=1306274 RepID=UPI001F55697D|nr:PEP-CTERM sorting domain-containing protein [Nostoc flagelliforme]
MKSALVTMQHNLSGIVFCNSRAAVKGLLGLIQRETQRIGLGYLTSKVAVFYSSLTGDRRGEIIQKLQAGQIKVIINYSGTEIAASGTFTTNDSPNDLGFYLISEISGMGNGETITGLQATRTPIPGNQPFELDNLISLNTVQLTGDGFGYSTSGRNYSSPFFAIFLPTRGYLEVFSVPPFVSGFENLGSEDSELPISFSASIIPVPEATSIVSLLALGTFSTHLAQ